MPAQALAKRLPAVPGRGDRRRGPAVPAPAGFAGRDVLSMSQYSRDDLEWLFRTADEMHDRLAIGAVAPELKGRILVSAFFERSTRTRMVHETAMLRLGGSVTGFADPASTRAGGATHESDDDVVRMLGIYGDVIVVRHPETGWPARVAAGLDDSLVINGGDGVGEHPTQTMTDLYTLRRRFGSLDGLRLLIVNDLRMRCVRSLLRGLRHFDCEVHAVAAEGKDAAAPGAGADGPPLHFSRSLPEILPAVDAVYSSPTVAVDTGEDGAALRTVTLDRALLERYGNDRLAVLHPLPRKSEVATDVDGTRFNAYWEQARNGLAVRMALLKLMFAS